MNKKLSASLLAFLLATGSSVLAVTYCWGTATYACGSRTLTSWFNGSCTDDTGSGYLNTYLTTSGGLSSYNIYQQVCTWHCYTANGTELSATDNVLGSSGTGATCSNSTGTH